MREATTRTLENAAVFHDLGHALALQRLIGTFLPSVRQKSRAVQLGQGRCDARLQASQIAADKIDWLTHEDSREAFEMGTGRMGAACSGRHPTTPSNWRTIRA